MPGQCLASNGAEAQSITLGKFRFRWDEDRAGQAVNPALRAGTGLRWVNGLAQLGGSVTKHGPENNALILQPILGAQR